MNDALDPSPPVFEVVSFLNAAIDLPKNDKFVSRQISGDLYEISFNPRIKYTQGKDSGSELIENAKSSDEFSNKYKPDVRDPDLRPGINPKTKNSTEMVSEWRRSIKPEEISDLRKSFLGDDFVKVDKGKWMSIDGKRMFRSVPEDFMGTHGMGKPTVSGQGHVHLEFLRKTEHANYVVTKNIHIPINK